MRAKWAILLIPALILLSQAVAWAENAYVVDKLVVALRQERSFSSPVVGRAESLDKVEQLKVEGKWSRIKLADGTTGWMPSRYLVTEPPKALRLTELDAENTRLAAQVDKLKNLNKELALHLTELEKKSTSLPQQSQEDLDRMAAVEAEMSGQMADLKDRYDKAKAELEKLRAKGDALAGEDNSSLSTRRLSWFLAGGGVLLAGWLAGLVVGRRRRSGPKMF